MLQPSTGPWLVHHSHSSTLATWHSQQLPITPSYFPHPHAVEGHLAASNSVHPPPVPPLLGPQPPALPHPDRNLRALRDPDAHSHITPGQISWPPDFHGIMDASTVTPADSQLAANRRFNRWAAEVTGQLPSGHPEWPPPPLPVAATPESPLMTSAVYSFSERTGGAVEPANQPLGAGVPYQWSGDAPHRPGQIVSAATTRRGQPTPSGKSSFVLCARQSK